MSVSTCSKRTCAGSVALLRSSHPPLRPLPPFPLRRRRIVLVLVLVIRLVLSRMRGVQQRLRAGNTLVLSQRGALGEVGGGLVAVEVGLDDETGVDLQKGEEESRDGEVGAARRWWCGWKGRGRTKEERSARNVSSQKEERGGGRS